MGFVDNAECVEGNRNDTRPVDLTSSEKPCLLHQGKLPRELDGRSCVWSPVETASCSGMQFTLNVFHCAHEMRVKPAEETNGWMLGRSGRTRARQNEDCQFGVWQYESVLRMSLLQQQQHIHLPAIKNQRPLQYTKSILHNMLLAFVFPSNIRCPGPKFLPSYALV